MKNPFERWHPKIALRYLPIVDEIKKSGLHKPQILEVGSGSLGIAPYLKLPLTGVDIKFEGPKFYLLNQVIGKATELPFADKSFDFVVSTDMLEHVPVQDRQKVISEILRCTRIEAFIAVPCGEKSTLQDKQLDKDYQRVFGMPYKSMQDHIRNGLPGKSWVNDTIEQEAKRLNKKVEIKIHANLNLTLRRFLMWGWITKNPIVDFIFRKVFLLFIPILKHMNQEPTYRQIFFVKMEY